jgi:enamine deaminase RidA (YjgF/YER057c/UK114 family)
MVGFLPISREMMEWMLSCKGGLPKGCFPEAILVAPRKRDSSAGASANAQPIPSLFGTDPRRRHCDAAYNFRSIQLRQLMSVQDKLKELGITLPPVATPAAAYVPFVRTGNLVFISGHIAKKDGKPWVGQLGKNMATEEGKAAARNIAIDLMGTLQAAVGDLSKVKRIVKVLSLVNSTPDFTEQHLVTNGCSELLGQVFGDKGAHARSAFGVAQIPMGACVEIELIAEVG